MEPWLKNSLHLVRSTFEDVSAINYKNLIYLFYEHFSNRALARFIGELYGKDPLMLYFEIDEIIAGNDYNADEVESLLVKLRQNGFDAWALDDN